MAENFDYIQHRLYEMEKDSPSPTRKLSLKERVKSLFLPFQTIRHEIEYADPIGASKARENFQKHGTYNSDVAYIIDSAKRAMNPGDRYHEPSPDQDCETLRENAVGAILSNESAYFALSHYLARGWEVPEELLKNYEESARIGLESITFLLDQKQATDVNPLLKDELRNVAGTLCSRLPKTHKKDWLGLIAENLMPKLDRYAA